MNIGLGSQFGNWSQDACTAGGLLCPQPQSFGASFNPCCWSSASSADDTTPASSLPFVLTAAVVAVAAFMWVKG